MHELSIAMSILDAVEETSILQKLIVTAVRVRIGPLSGVVGEALRFAFENACRQAMTGQVRLDIDDAPLTAMCPKCGIERPVESVQKIVCSVCGTPTPQIIGGREMEIISFELADDPNAYEDL